MTELTIDLRAATGFVAVANTPLFVVRRLRESDATKRAHDLHGGKAIFEALQRASRTAPKTIEKLAEVYFYAVALSFDPDISWIRKALAIDGVPIRWLKEILTYLEDTAVSTNRTDLKASTSSIAGGAHIIVPSAIATANTTKLIEV